MKQRQSFSVWFNHQESMYAKRYIKSNRRLLLVVITVLGLLVSGMLFSDTTMNFGFSLMGLDYYNGVYARQSYGNIQNLMLAICLLAYLLPLYQFHFLMKRSSSDLYLSLPIRRERLFYVHYLTGAGLLIFITIIEACIYFIFHLYDFDFYSCASIIILVVLGICLYTFFTFLVLKCRSLLDAILICAIYTLLPVIFHFAMQSFINTIGDDLLIAYSWYGPYLEFNGIISYVTTLLSIPWLMTQWIHIIFQSPVMPFLACFLYTIVWGCFSISCFFWARKSFLMLKSEDSEQPSSSLLTYPLTLPMLALAAMLGLGKGDICSFTMVLIFLFYLIAYFAAQRKLKITWKQLLSFTACVLISTTAYQISVETNFFHIIKEIPDIESIESARLSVAFVHTQQTTDVLYETSTKHFDTVNGELYGEDGKRLCYEQEKILTIASDKENMNDSDVAYVSFDYREKETEQKYTYEFHRTYLVTEENLPKLEALINLWQSENLISPIDF